MIANSLTPAVFETPILLQMPPSQVEYMRGKIPMDSFTTAATFDSSGGRTTF